MKMKNYDKFIVAGLVSVIAVLIIFASLVTINSNKLLPQKELECENRCIDRGMKYNNYIPDQLFGVMNKGLCFCTLLGGTKTEKGFMLIGEF